MEEIIAKYNKLLDGEKELLKSILKEILDLEIKKEKNKGKKFINQEEIDKGIKKGFDFGIKIIVDKGFITKQKLEKLTEEEVKDLFNNYIRIENKNKEKFILFPVYIGNDLDSIVSYNIFCKRLDTLKFLDKYKIIKISSLKIFDTYNKIKKIDKRVKDEFLKMKKDLYKKHPKYIIDKQFEFLSKIQDNFVIVVVFEKEKLKKLLSVFKEVDIGKFKFESGNLFYGGKIIYTPKQNTDRYIFLTLFFTKEKGKFISLKEIFDELEGFNGARFTENQGKRIYRIRTDLNKKIKKVSGIQTELFTLGKGLDEGKIQRKF